MSVVDPHHSLKLGRAKTAHIKRESRFSVLVPSIQICLTDDLLEQIVPVHQNALPMERNRAVLRVATGEVFDVINQIYRCC